MALKVVFRKLDFIPMGYGELLEDFEQLHSWASLVKVCRIGCVKKTGLKAVTIIHREIRKPTK